MSFWYNEPKDGSKFAQLNCNDWDGFTTKAILCFDELVVKETPEAYYCFAYVKEATDVEKSGVPGFKLQSQLVTWVLHKTAYDKRKKEGDKWVTEKKEPSETEKWWCEIFNHYKLAQPPEGHGFTGFIKCCLSEYQVDCVLRRNQSRWKYTEESAIAQVNDTCIFVPTLLEHLKGIDLPLPETKKQWSGGGSKAQTEAERLKDKWEFCKLHFPLLTADCQTLEEVCRKLVLMNPTERSYSDLSLDTMIDFMQ